MVLSEQILKLKGIMKDKETFSAEKLSEIRNVMSGNDNIMFMES
jgi:hypothetical protein